MGDLISDVDSGRPFGMSTERLRLSRRDSRRDECLSRDECDDLVEERLSLSEECLDELVLEDECLLDFSLGTSRMFKVRPVVGSVVDD